MRTKREIESRRLTARLVDQLYTEAMLLADEVRGYFDEAGRQERESLSPSSRVAFSCESLKITTRLMHVIAWLLTRRALELGEIGLDEARAPSRRLGPVADSQEDVINALPVAARALIEASRDLYERIARLDADADRPAGRSGPARTLQRRLERAF